jgi:hypothetical protein
VEGDPERRLGRLEHFTGIDVKCMPSVQRLPCLIDPAAEGRCGAEQIKIVSRQRLPLVTATRA